MITLDNINTSCSPTRPCALTIGSFDGVHRGHQKILQKAREKVGKNGSVCVITFSNHPSHILSGHSPVLLILSKPLKMKALEDYGVDLVYCIPFTEEIAALPYDVFLKTVRQHCPFDFLVLGEGASLGNKRGGTPEKVAQLGKELGFSCEYVEKAKSGEQIISSRAIRECILKGDLATAAEFLGRPFTIEGTLQSGQLFVSPHLCLPPEGKYSVLINETEKGMLMIQDGALFLQSSMKEGKVEIAFVIALT